MTYKGAIDEVKILENHPFMPDIFKPSLKKIAETLEMERPKGEWRPVSERLPEDEEDVLVYCGQFCGQGMMDIAYYHNDYTFYPSEYADLDETGW